MCEYVVLTLCERYMAVGPWAWGAELQSCDSHPSLAPHQSFHMIVLTVNHCVCVCRESVCVNTLCERNMAVGPWAWGAESQSCDSHPSLAPQQSFHMIVLTVNHCVCVCVFSPS